MLESRVLIQLVQEASRDREEFWQLDEKVLEAVNAELVDQAESLGGRLAQLERANSELERSSQELERSMRP